MKKFYLLRSVIALLFISISINQINAKESIVDPQRQNGLTSDESVVNSIVQSCINIPEFILEYNQDPTGVPYKMFALDPNQVFSSTPDVDVFGTKLQLTTIEYLVDNNFEYYLSFSQLTIDNHFAKVVMTIVNPEKTQTYEISLSKKENKWLVTSKSLIDE